MEAIDLAHDRLQATLDRLKETIVDASLQRHDLSATSAFSEHPSTARTLHDFIDESGHQNLFESLRQDINHYNTLSNTFHDTQADLDKSLSILADALTKADGASRRPLTHPSKQTSDPEPPQHIPDLFQSLTTHATDIAALLQSLIEHYDLCSTALKHTEGGGDAARAATEDTTSTPPDDNDPAALDASLFTNKHRDPITLAEKAEMLSVLDTDAQEVDDVVLEIRDRLVEMESQLQLLQTQTRQTRTQHRLLAAVLAHLHDIGARLPTHVLAAREFSASWSAIRASLDTKGDELAALDSIYQGFLTSYSLLLTEVSRRAASEAKIQKTMDEARRRVEQLTANELEMRKAFFEQVGDFLPRDIWADLEVAPRRWGWEGVEQPGLRHVLGLDRGVEGAFDAEGEGGIGVEGEEEIAVGVGGGGEVQ